MTTPEHDPLCYAPSPAARPGGCRMCRALRTARLQGPVIVRGHAAICWCDACEERRAGS
jgi:hypothetical protein